MSDVTIIAIARNPLKVWTDAIARRATLNRLQKAANLFAEIAVIWDDVDQCAVSTVEGLGREVEDVARSLQEFWAERDGEVA